MILKTSLDIFYSETNKVKMSESKRNNISFDLESEMNIISWLTSLEN